MAMGTRESEQSSLWIPASDLPKSPSHPFYARLNALLDAHAFDRFVEEVTATLLAARGESLTRPTSQPIIRW